MDQKKIDALHAIMLEEIKAVHAICEKHDIYYFANGGTCLGAVREHGFIPWDDDVDINFLRDGYEKFVKVAPEELAHYTGSPYRMYITDHNGVRGIRIATDVDDPVLGKTTVEIDPVIFDHLPKSKIKQKMMRFRILSYRAMIAKKRGKMGFAMQMYTWLMGIIGRIKTYKGVQKSHDKLATKYNNVKDPYPFYISTIDAFSITLHNTYPVEWFEERILMPFEDTEIYVPKMYDAYLTYEYGDYMKRPPIEKQVPAHDKF